MSAPADAALVLHGLGWNVLPLGARSKRPCVASWERWATERQIHLPEGFALDGNVGVITGSVSDLVVVDTDDKDARDTVIEHVRGALERTPIARTRAGWHFYFAHPGGKRPNRARVGGIGLDARADGGYVVAPPSVHASGDRYTWTVSPFDHRPIDMPASLVEHLWPPQVARVPSMETPMDHSDAYVRAALEHEAAAVRSAPHGERNHVLNVAAYNLGRFVDTGELDFGYVFEILLVAATRNGLPEHEAKRTIQSGLSARRLV